MSVKVTISRHDTYRQVQVSAMLHHRLHDLCPHRITVSSERGKTGCRHFSWWSRRETKRSRSTRPAGCRPGCTIKSPEAAGVEAEYALNIAMAGPELSRKSSVANARRPCWRRAMCRCTIGAFFHHGYMRLGQRIVTRTPMLAIF